MSTAAHFLRKLGRTIRIACTLMMARTFGKYEVSIYADGVSYAKYWWRGQCWAFPTEPIKTDYIWAPSNGYVDRIA